MQAIVAFDLNGGIGLNNKLPWRIKEDLQFFKNFTTGKKIVVGGNTYNSLPPNGLPGRQVIGLSKGIICYPIHTLDKYVVNDITTIPDYKDVIIAGGAQIYKKFVPLCDELYITSINGNYKCDVFFPFSFIEIRNMFPVVSFITEFPGGHKIFKHSKK